MDHFYKGYRVAIHPVRNGFDFDVFSAGGLARAGYVLDSNDEAGLFGQIKLRIDGLFSRRASVAPMLPKAGSGSPPVKTAQREIAAWMRGGRGAATRARFKAHAGDETRPPRAPFRCGSVPAASPR